MAKWYYMENEEQNGPIEEEELLQMVRDGKITSSTLVRMEESGDWNELKDTLQDSKNRETTVSSAHEENCSICGNKFAKNDMMQYENSWICAGCKPEFALKLKEGVDLGLGSYTYAGFWRRFVAVFIDGILLAVVNWIFGLALLPLASSTTVFGAASIIAMVLQLVIPIVYEVYFISTKGATLGKMALGIKVISSDGGPVTSATALGRYFAKILSGLILMIGYIMAGFDEQKRALHDHICNTRVIISS